MIAGLAASPAASAATPALSYWTGQVTRVADGDTIYVDVSGDSIGAIPVRAAGLQTTELATPASPKAECGAVAATNLMKALLPVGSWVRLAAYSASSTLATDAAGVPRRLRYIDDYNPTTRLYDIDLQRRIIEAGLGVAGPQAVETARAASYRLPQQAAAQRKLGLFNPRLCNGPSPDTTLQMWTHYDANVETDPNGEWMRIRNLSSSTLSLTGWKLRDGGHTWYRGTTYYTFPNGSNIPAGKTITIYPGSGTTSPAAGRYYLGVATTPTFFPNNVNPALGYPGKAMFLLDPQLTFRATADYPCMTGCAKPAVRISAVQPRTGDEYVDITVNPGVTTPVDVTAVTLTNDGWTKELAPGTKLSPGERLRVYCNRSGTDTRLTQYWGHTGGTMLEDGGDTVVLRTANSTVLSTSSWGTG